MTLIILGGFVLLIIVCAIFSGVQQAWTDKARIKRWNEQQDLADQIRWKQ